MKATVEQDYFQIQQMLMNLEKCGATALATNYPTSNRKEGRDEFANKIYKGVFEMA